MTTEPQIAPEPGGMAVGDKVPESVGSHEMTITSIERGQWVWVYSTEDGRRIPLNINMRQYIDPLNPRAWRNASGQIAFTYQKPEFAETIPAGSIKCMLHPENPSRSYLDGIGLKGRYCKMGDNKGGKSNLVSEFDLERHMLKSHQGEYRIITGNKTTLERAEDRADRKQASEAQQRTSDAMLAMAETLRRDNVDDNSAGQSEGDREGADAGDGPARRRPGRPKQN